MFGLLAQFNTRYEIAITCDPEEDYSAFNKSICKYEIGEILENGVEGFPVKSQVGVCEFWSEIVNVLWDIKTPFIINKPGVFGKRENSSDHFYNHSLGELSKRMNTPDIINLQKGKVGSLKF